MNPPAMEKVEDDDFDSDIDDDFTVKRVMKTFTTSNYNTTQNKIKLNLNTEEFEL